MWDEEIHVWMALAVVTTLLLGVTALAVELGIASAQAKAWETVTVPVQIKNNPGFMSFDIKITIPEGRTYAKGDESADTQSPDGSDAYGQARISGSIRQRINSAVRTKRTLTAPERCSGFL